MAYKLHTRYYFSYGIVKVLLGGWNTWKQENAKDPNAYPISTVGEPTPTFPPSQLTGPTPTP